MLMRSTGKIRDWKYFKCFFQQCFVQEFITLEFIKQNVCLSLINVFKKDNGSISSTLKSLNYSLAQCQFRIDNHDELALKSIISCLTGTIQAKKSKHFRINI